MADRVTWAKRVSAWRASGETAGAFSARSGCAPSTLRWWASRLRAERAGFVRVVTASAPNPDARDATITIEIAGARVLVRPGVDRDALADVLDVLRRSGAS